jgi:hypothetical protein
VVGMTGRPGDPAGDQGLRQLLAGVWPRVPALVEHGQTARVSSDNVQTMTIVPRGFS